MKPKPTTTRLLPGPAGQLEVLLQKPDINSRRVIAILCHPNPLHGGTMHNKVVTTLARTFEKAHIPTLRFNYRGVGESEGHYGHVDGEIDDLTYIIEWVVKQYPKHTIWLAGFSFGSFISAYVANQDTRIQRLLSIAPAVTWHDFNQLTHITCPWTAILAEADEIVDVKAALAFVKQPPSPLNYHIVPEASHFFHGKLIELAQWIDDFASENHSHLY